MILIADSGSTKTEWSLVGRNGVERTFRTAGINPYLLSEDEVRRILTREVLVELPIERITEVYFYGAGCVGRPAETLCVQLHRVIGPETVEVNSDLLAAARALCGDAPGIVAILGTGSNSGYYDGHDITRRVPSLGFLLGDEGSGSDLGKHLLADALKGLLPEPLARQFFDCYPLTQEEVLDAVYRRPMPNRYMARFLPSFTSTSTTPTSIGWSPRGLKPFSAAISLHTPVRAAPCTWSGRSLTIMPTCCGRLPVRCR